MKSEISSQDRDALDTMSTQTAGVVPLQFVQVDAYTTFRAEYALDGNDFVLHFFKTPEHEKDVGYWINRFPVALDTVARAHFQATRPRLVAAYTEEMDSWWLRAKDYSTVLNKDGYILKFLEKLDQTLDTMTSK